MFSFGIREMGWVDEVVLSWCGIFLQLWDKLSSSEMIHINVTVEGDLQTQVAFLVRMNN